MKNSTLFTCAIFAMLLAACGANTPQPTPTETVIFVPTQTDTPSPTNPPPTATQIPSATPSPFPTLPILATLTPATPAKSAEAYHLATQTADQANETIARLEQLIPTLENDPRSFQDDFYPPYYRAIWYVAWDALVHFPNDPRAEIWRWKMAHYMALSGDVNEAIQTYNDLITVTLNSAHVSMDNLPKHILLGNTDDSLFTPSFVMETKIISVPHADQGFIATIGNLNHPDTPIAACFLIIENAGKYTSYFIQHSFLDFGYSIMRRDSIDCSPKDVTDDKIDEIITNRYTGGHAGYYTFQVFDTTSLPPKVMPFTERGKRLDAWKADIQDYPKIDGKTQLQFYDFLGFLDCESYQVENYQWNGNSFELRDRKINYGPVPYPLDFCTSWVFDYANQLTTKDAVIFLDEAIKAYQPYAGKDVDLLEEFQIQKALYYIFDGDQETARSILKEIVTSPLAKDSIWIEPVQKFLDAYQTPSDLYKASTLLTACAPYRNAGGQNPCTDVTPLDSTWVLSNLLNNEYLSTHPSELTTMLKSIGVKIGGEGWFDFDRDGKNELWFTSIDPKDKTPWLWIVVATSKGNDAFFIGEYEPETPKPTLTVDLTQSGHIFINYGGYDGEKFELIHDPSTGEPDIHTIDPADVPEEKQQAIEQDLAKFKDLRQMLYMGSEAAPIYDQMVAIDRKYPECPFTIEYYLDPAASYDCASFYYTLAFSAELAGKGNEAVKRYYAVWSVFPDNPFAILSRLKLQK